MPSGKGIYLVSGFTSFRDLKIRKKVGGLPKSISDPVRTSIPRSSPGCNFPSIVPDRAGDAKNTGEIRSVKNFTELASARQRKQRITGRILSIILEKNSGISYTYHQCFACVAGSSGWLPDCPVLLLVSCFADVLPLLASQSLLAVRHSIGLCTNRKTPRNP